ncbi:glycoside hydrolase [Jaminaea rosea]|uniref:Glycoside hydrolase n=1 Tax=Jaminaea rosea TaxID=1569628 RepID=A0A316UK30_9BASI|nr:glycoside hydrolase [Jaminaea rosea]PWN25158.1 glycoside hydrolase [Jaminaea rosea]
MPSTRELVGMNVLTLAFLTSNTSSFRAQKFFNYSVPERRRIVNLYHSKGISLFLSTFGGDPNEQPVTQNFNPTMLGDLHGEIAYKSGFDGLDNDIEDFEAFSWHNKSLVTWVSMYTEAVRRWLPASGGFGMSAAPVAPWFTPNRTTYCHGAYDGIDKQVGHLYDFYNVQFYNQGVGSYDDCKNLLFKSNLTAFPQTSIFEIARNGVPLDKLLIAKPGYPVDAASGYVPPEKLSYCLHLAKNNGWKAGAASWQFPHASTQWWRELRMDSFYDESLFAKRPID